MPAVRFEGDRLSVHFDRFDPSAYERFLQIKRLPESQIAFDPETASYTITAPRRFAPLLGEQLPQSARGDAELSPFLFDDQAAIVRMLLDAKRYAVWSGVGNGKTLIQLEGARQIINRTDGRVLIVTLNDIVPQTIEMCGQFYGDSLPIKRLESRHEMREWCKSGEDGKGGPGLAITNYEKFNPDADGQEIPEIRHLAGLFVDENRLKGGGAKQKWAIIKSAKGVEYKASFTATPAPNDTIEFASQASFLETMRDDKEIIWTYFQRDQKSHRWVIKRHARKAFFEFMSAWSIYVQDPRRYGWRKDCPDVPEPVVLTHEVPITREQQRFLETYTADAAGQRSLFRARECNAIERMKLSQVAKGFRYLKDDPNEIKKTGAAYDRLASLKPGVVSDLVQQDCRDGLQCLVWTVFDAETQILSEELQARGIEFETLTGATKRKDRTAILDRYRRGDTPVLIARPSMLGYGLNFQHVGSMVFSGFTDSFETHYQAIGRAVRYGQKRNVRVHLPIVRELEGDILENVLAKQERHKAAVSEMEANYIEARQRLNERAAA